MSIRDKKTVLKTIRHRTLTVGGKDYPTYEIYFGTDGHGKKLRENRASLKDAKARIDEFFEQRKILGDAASVLKPTEVYDAKAALDMLRAEGLTVCLTETARAYIEGTAAKPRCRDKKIGDAYKEYYDAITDRQYLHKAAVKARVGKWIGEFGPDRMVSEVTSAELAAYLDPMRKTAKTFNNSLSYIRTFISWCAKSERQYIVDAPLADMKTMKVAYKEPDFMKPDELERLIRALEIRKDAPRVMPFIALSFFCGVRQEEIKRLIDSRKDIDLDAETVRISMPKGWTQGIAPRIFQLQPNALAWLMRYETSPVLCKSPAACLKTIAAVAAREKVKLGRNIGRHSFITYHAAKFQNPILTDTMTGTSKKMRAAHYQGLANKADAERYFAITPAVQ